MRQNLLARLCNGGPLFAGVIGYEETVMPQIVNAILSRHNFILLGLRGQAKSRILRQLVTLLDEEIPVLEGSEVNDDPFRPISKYGRELVTEKGDRTPSAGCRGTRATWRSSPPPTSPSPTSSATWIPSRRRAGGTC